MSSNRIRVFVDTNVDASLLLLETSKTTIAELKRHVEERIRTNYNEMVDAPKGFSDNTLERINCLFDAASPSRERENCFTVPDEYTIGSIASDQNVVRVFAEYSIPVVRQKQSAFVTPARSSKKRVGEKGAAQAPSTQKKQRTPEAVAAQIPAKGNEEKKEGITRVPSSNTLKNQKKREKRKRKRESARLVDGETKDVASPEPKAKEPLVLPGSEVKSPIAPQKPLNDGSGTSKVATETKKKKKDKNAPKRGMSAFMFYSNDMRDKVKAENPGIAFGDVAKRISAMWKDLSDSEKVKYNDLAEKDKQRYVTAMETYNAESQKDVVASPKAQEKKPAPEPKQAKAPAAPSDKSDSSSSSSDSDSSDSSSSDDEEGKDQVKEVSKSPVKAKDPTDSSDSSSSSSSDSSDDSDSSSPSSSSSDSDTSDEEPLKAQPSGKFDGADGGVLSQLLQSATNDDDKSKKVNVEELKKKAVKDKEAKEQKERDDAVPETFQWQKSHKNFNADSLVKLCRTMVRTIVNHEREAKGLNAVPISKLYKDQENRPDWWPLGDFTSGSFEKKGDAITVYNAARKVLSAIYDVTLDES